MYHDPRFPVWWNPLFNYDSNELKSENTACTFCRYVPCCCSYKVQNSGSSACYNTLNAHVPHAPENGMRVCAACHCHPCCCPQAPTYGNDCKKQCEIIVQPVAYKEHVLHNIQTSNHFQNTISFDISEQNTVSFIIVNQSISHNAEVKLQCSPNDQLYQMDVPQVIVAPGSFMVLTPTRFLRFARIAYRSKDINHPVTIDIYYQAQGNGNP